MIDGRLLTLEEWGGTANGNVEMRLPAAYLWAHHSVTNEDIGVPATEHAIADFLELDAIGLSRGHGGISYSYAIHPSGIVGEGQGLRIGAHTLNWNHNSFGVVFVGNFDDDELTPDAIRSFQWLRDVHLRDHLVTGRAYPTGGHRDAPGNSTGCPGAHIEGDLEQLRSATIPAPPAPDDPGDDDPMFILVLCTYIEPNPLFLAWIDPATGEKKYRHVSASELSNGSLQRAQDLGLIRPGTNGNRWHTAHDLNYWKQVS